MTIKSNASPDEKSSPFYQKNEQLCRDWEQFILDRDGKINAVFNAWSAHIDAKVKVDRTWVISVKKAIYSNGSILFSSRYQNLQELLELQAHFRDYDCPNFRITPSIFTSRRTKHPFCTEVELLLNLEQRKSDRNWAKFKNGKLTVVFSHRNDDFELVKRIFNLSKSLSSKA